METASLRNCLTAVATRSIANSTSFGGIEPAEAEAEAAAGGVFRESQGPQDVAGLGIGRGAGGSAADGQVAHCHEQGLAVDVAEGEIEVAGKAERRAVIVSLIECRAADLDFIELVEDPGGQAIAEGGEAGHFLRQFGEAELERCCEADDAGDVERAAAATFLLAAAA